MLCFYAQFYKCKCIWTADSCRFKFHVCSLTMVTHVPDMKHTQSLKCDNISFSDNYHTCCNLILDYSRHVANSRFTFCWLKRVKVDKLVMHQRLCRMLNVYYTFELLHSFTLKQELQFIRIMVRWSSIHVIPTVLVWFHWIELGRGNSIHCNRKIQWICENRSFYEHFRTHGHDLILVYFNIFHDLNPCFAQESLFDLTALIICFSGK